MYDRRNKKRNGVWSCEGKERHRSLSSWRSESEIPEKRKLRTFFWSSWILVSQFLSSCEICLKEKRRDSLLPWPRGAAALALCPWTLSATWSLAGLVMGGQWGFTGWLERALALSFPKKNTYNGLNDERSACEEVCGTACAWDTS